MDNICDSSKKSSVYSPIILLWTHFRSAYTNVKVLQWSILYAVGFCGHMQVISYIQLMWKEIEPTPDVSKANVENEMFFEAKYQIMLFLC